MHDRAPYCTWDEPHNDPQLLSLSAPFDTTTKRMSPSGLRWTVPLQVNAVQMRSVVQVPLHEYIADGWPAGDRWHYRAYAQFALPTIISQVWYPNGEVSFTFQAAIKKVTITKGGVDYHNITGEPVFSVNLGDAFRRVLHNTVETWFDDSDQFWYARYAYSAIVRYIPDYQFQMFWNWDCVTQVVNDHSFTWKANCSATYGYYVGTVTRAAGEEDDPDSSTGDGDEWEYIP